ncbi:MAG: tRNA-binding protein [Longimicrobiales bacterium]
MSHKPTVAFDAFAALDIRAGQITRVEPFPEARKPAFKIWVDFGEGIGTLQSSAQLTKRYSPETLVGIIILAVVNFAPRRIAGFESQILILGMMNPSDDGDVVLVRPDDSAVMAWPLG